MIPVATTALTPVIVKPKSLRIVNRIPSDIIIKLCQVLGQAIDLADVAGDRGPFVVGKHLPLEPGTAAIVEQIGRPALRHEMSLQDAVYLVLHPCVMPQNLDCAGQRDGAAAPSSRPDLTPPAESRWHEAAPERRHRSCRS
ncbi:hypothetical protein NKJ35_30440 [Mesorhizobium sp. M0136]|uniref:hypothetical protein n=1 Tax=Mesorhizobium sp. M0136 TaxID=2956890 RepID=UPI003334DD18